MGIRDVFIFAVMVDDRKRKVGLLEEQNGRQARSLRIVGDDSSSTAESACVYGSHLPGNARHGRLNALCGETEEAPGRACRPCELQ